MFQNKIIIIGANHHNTLGLVRSVGEIGIRPDVLVHGDSFNLLKSSKYVNKISIVPIDNIINYLLSNYSDESLKPILLCGEDETMSVIDKSITVVEKYFYCFNALHQEGRITSFMDKGEMQRVAKICGLICPQSFYVSRNSKLPSNLPFPCMIKPISSLDGTKAELKKCENIHELLTKMSIGITYQLQEYISKEYELNMVGCSLDHGNKIVAPGIIRKIREYPVRLGSSSFSVLESFESHKSISLDKIQGFIKAIGYEGLFSVEFLHSNGKDYFLEINMRNDGNGYVPTSAGVNLPAIWCNYVTGKPIKENKAVLPHYFMRDSNDFRHILEGRITFRKWYEDYRRTNCFLLYKRGDALPFLSYWKGYVRAAFIVTIKKLLKK